MTDVVDETPTSAPASEVDPSEANEDIEEDEYAIAETPTSNVKLFGKWSFDDIQVHDMSLADYIACNGPHAVFLPHTAGRYQKKRFRKSSCPIVERLVCCLMRKGNNSGKKLMAVCLFAL